MLPEVERGAPAIAAGARRAGTRAPSLWRVGSACIALVALACSDDSGAGGAGGTSSIGAVGFATDIHPILVAKCSGSTCHTEDSRPFRPGHAADDVETAYAATQAAGVDGAPVYERIIVRASSEDAVSIMPPEYADPPCLGAVGAPGCLTAQELATIQAWVAQGAPP